jgi:diguanylate cyclase (GGDEF)-like protein/PAS domain S-box-containing protein
VSPVVGALSLHVLVGGALLAGWLVAGWEADALLARTAPPLVRRLWLAGAMPAALLLLPRWGPLAVPFGCYVLLLVSVWYLQREPWGIGVGTGAVVAAGLIAVWVSHGLSPRAAVDAAELVGLVPAVVIVSRRLDSRRALVVLAGGTILLNTAVMMITGDGAAAVARTLIVSLLAGAYLVARADRERRWAEDVRRAEHDALTGVLSRHGWEAWNRLHAGVNPPQGLVVMVDLDDFKLFNDTFGHDVGDEVLRETAARLAGACRAGDAVVRVGGDEFAVWMPSVAAADVPVVVERLHRAVTGRPYVLSVGPIGVTASLGAAFGPLTPATARAADQQLLEAKRRGKGRAAWASPAEVVAPVAPAAWEPTPVGWLAEAVEALWRDWPEAAVLTDATGRIVAVNPAYERLTGRPRAELVGRKPGVNSAGTTEAAVYRELWERLARGEAWVGTLLNRRPDGTYWWAAEEVVPVRVGGRTVGYWAHVREQATRSLPLGDAASPNPPPADAPPNPAAGPLLRVVRGDVADASAENRGG